jgi:hypothetical protein
MLSNDDLKNEHASESDFLIGSEFTRPKSRNNSGSRSYHDNNRSSQQINILRSNPAYSSVEEGSVHTVPTVDYETLLTLALEKTSQNVDVENKKKQNFLFGAIGLMLILSLCILAAVTYTSYPEEHELHSQIITLENDVNKLNSEVNHYRRNEDIDLLLKDIDDKKVFIEQLEHDSTIDPETKARLVEGLQGEINDLKTIVAQLEAEENGDVVGLPQNKGDGSNG